jgi:hypothetical protein
MSETIKKLRGTMASALSRCCPKLLARYRAKHLLRKPGSYLRETGYLKSLEQLSPVDAEGAPLPFLNYAVIELLKKRLDKNLDVFEFGSGYSTLFFARLVRTVTSVEHDAGWLERVRQLAKGHDNVELISRSLEDGYAASVSTTGRRYDLILVDGRMRNECAEQAVKCLTEAGVILWDDSSRDRYAEGMVALEAAGYRRLPISGLKPAGFGTDETSFFYRAGNCLGI